MQWILTKPRVKTLFTDTEVNNCFSIDPLHVRGNAANLEDRTIRFFYMRIDLNSQKRKFLLFCSPDWLHSHRRPRGLFFIRSAHMIYIYHIHISHTCMYVCMHAHTQSHTHGQIYCIPKNHNCTEIVTGHQVLSTWRERQAKHRGV